MIDRYTIKFAPAVSQKELEKALHDDAGAGKEHVFDLRKMKARIEFVGDFEDVQKIQRLLKELAPKETGL